MRRKAPEICPTIGGIFARRPTDMGWVCRNREQSYRPLARFRL